jgi:hypothetical protein
MYAEVSQFLDCKYNIILVLSLEFTLDFHYLRTSAVKSLKLIITVRAGRTPILKFSTLVVEVLLEFRTACIVSRGILIRLHNSLIMASTKRMS